MPLIRISDDAAINLKNISAVKRGENNTSIILINGEMFQSSFSIDQVISAYEQIETQPVTTTSDSQFAG